MNAPSPLMHSLSRVYLLFRPDDEALSAETKSQIQVYRLLTVLGIVLVPLFGVLYDVSNPGAIDPMWARLVITGVFACIFAASYASRQLRRNYVVWLRGLLYVLMGWLTVLAALNGFASDYVVGHVITYAILTVVVGLGARSLAPVLWFLAFGFLLTGVGTAVVPVPRTSSLILLASMAAIALGEGIAIGKLISTREELAAREEQLRTITENVSEGIYRSTPDEGLVYANQAFAEMFGYESVDAVLAADPLQMYANPEEREQLRRIARKEGGFDAEEVEFCRKDGSTFPGLLDATVVRSEEGEVEYYDGALTDLTEQKRREARLGVMAQALEQAGDKILIADREGQIQYVNEAFEEITGYREEEVAGKTPRVLRSGVQDDAFYEELWETILSGETFRAEFVNEKKDGSRYIEDESISPVTDGEGQITHFVSTSRDITERKEREAALRQQRHLLEQAQRLAGAWEVDLQADELLWTKEVYHIHELPPNADVDVETAIDFYAPEARPRLREAYERCVEEGEPYDLEVPILTAEENRRWIRTTGAPVEEEEGEVLKVAGAVQDITERKRAEEALREERDRRAALFENASDPIMEVRFEEETPIISEVNPAFDETFGIEEEEALGLAVSEAVVPESKQEEHERRRHRVLQGERVETEVRREAAEGFREFLLRIIPMDKEGASGEAYAWYTDITEQKRREQKLREAKKEAEEARELFETIFNNVPVLIDFFDAEGNLQMVNEHWEEVLGWSEEEIKELSDPTEVLYPDPAERQESLAFMEEAPDEWRDFRFQTKSGEVLDTTWTNAELSDGQRIGIGLDITARKERERRLREAKEEAEEASQLKSAMLANMSHEVRTPLTSINGFSEILKEELSPPHVDLAERVYRSGKRLMKTLDSVLELSKLEAGVYDLEREPVRLDEVVEEAVDLLRPKAEEKSLALRTKIPAVPVEGSWNEGALTRIVENLLENAIKFTPEGGRVELRVRAEGEEATLEVEDTGVGISEEAISQIFEAFKQESEGLDREYEGSGLGLSIVREMAEALGGVVEVETEKGEGTCFTVRLPL